jgi:hypothetical protein
MPPPALPYSAEKLLERRLNSCTASRVGEGQARIEIGIVVIGAVHLEVDLAAVGRAGEADTVDVRGLFGGVDAALSADAATVTAGIDRANRQIHQTLRAPAVERKLDDRQLIDHLAAGRGAAGDQLSLASDRYLVRHLSDLQRDGYVRSLVDYQRDTGLHIGGEALLFDAQFIGADAQSGEQERSGRAGRGVLREAGLGVSNGHFGAGHGGAS